MKNIPNAITVLRIILSVSLFFVRLYPLLFCSVYIICGLSDIADGYIARKYHLTSQLGSRLDTLADTIFVFIMLIIYVPILKFPKLIIIWILMIALVKVAAIIIALFKYRRITGLHTYLNKAAGLALFCCPILLTFVSALPLSWLMCIICGIAAVEELTIQIISKELNVDTRGIFMSYASGRN